MMNSVSVYSCTQPIDRANQAEKPDLAAIIAYVARISNPASQAKSLNNERLLKYLIDHRHWSPFEMVDVTMEVTTPRDIARQLLRHRSFSFQEFSQRYASIESIAQGRFLRQGRMQDHSNRQNSLENNDQELHDQWLARQEQLLKQVEDTYMWALDNGIAKECARVVLPEGLTPSKLFVKGSVRSWLHYIDLRTGPETQFEHRDLAEKCGDQLITVLPTVVQHFKKG